ncbi:GDYXXLXY domain-containing protein [Gilvimarinus agarilyticus]|uniref:GDYXXLXY domain-containing protein n=1 Tax=Gilvimarinus sp. 2_MG-2023 TaxID=3062666 RepID=UPI001C09ABBD|nr:GDYXXLXY domain-containing protein [Gilvimarinus sp. 2_MG-2023]MBU2887825.1 GDYXXLXY domain-containing protein [Gilvimarinus agarilyticus]MDO6572463.1 GDYXXLXY domain-containing protein [Gilvimarinus sp. 2_MG-2023]
MNRLIALVALSFILALVNISIWHKQQHLANGQPVLLELAPVDPRSLIQGDYMVLRFKLAGDIDDALTTQSKPLTNHQGYAIISLDNNGVASLVRIDNGTALADDELRIEYRVRDHRIKFATNAFFFQEGTADVYSTARYGMFRLNDNGEPLLTDLYDSELKRLSP